jgi:hypothetical protein
MAPIKYALALPLFLIACNTSPQAKTAEQAQQSAVPQSFENEAVSEMKSRFAFGFCEKYDASTKINDDLADEFYAAFPKELIEANGAEKAALSPEEIDELARELTCAAALTAVPDVPESALALFQSKKYGGKLMQAVTQLSNSKTPYAKAAKDFKERMQSYMDGPGE